MFILPSDADPSFGSFFSLLLVAADLQMSDSSPSLSEELKRDKTACASCLLASAPKRCSRCRVTCYCSETCQKQHWSTHRQVCMPTLLLTCLALEPSSSSSVATVTPRQIVVTATCSEHRCADFWLNLTMRLRESCFERFPLTKLFLFYYMYPNKSRIGVIDYSYHSVVPPKACTDPSIMTAHAKYCEDDKFTHKTVRNADLQHPLAFIVLNPHHFEFTTEMPRQARVTEALDVLGVSPTAK